MNVRFFAGTKSQYLDIAKHNPVALYFCYDSRELFWGDKLISDGMRVVSTYAELPNLCDNSVAEGVVYYVAESRNGYVLSPDRSEWLQVIYAPGNGNGQSADLSAYYTKSEADAAIVAAIAKIEIPNLEGFLKEIPAEYITEEELNAKGFLTEHQDLSDYAKKSDIPTDYLTAVPDEYITETELIEELEKLEHPVVDLEGYATELYVDSKIASIEIPEPDLSEYAKLIDIPDVSNFITEVPAEFITESELDAKGYLTEHQDLSSYATKAELFNKDYNELVNTPSIPSIDGLATEDFVRNAIAEAELNDKDIDVSCFATKDDIKNFASTSYVDEKVSEIEIPTNVSAFINDAGYLTEHQSLEGYAKTEDIPDVSKFITSIPDEYITDSELAAELAKIEHPTISLDGYATEAWVNDQGFIKEHQDLSHLAEKDHAHDNYAEKDHEHEQYLTEHQSLESYAKKEELFSRSYNDLTDKPEIPNVDNFITMEQVEAKNYLTEVPTDYAKKSDIPSLDGYAKTEEIPTDYLTEADLAGYSKFSGSYNDLTDKPEIPSVDGLASEEYVGEAVKNFATNEQLAAKANDILFTESKIVKTPVGGFVADEDINGLTIAQLFAKLLGLNDNDGPEKPPVEPDSSTVGKIMAEQLPMYQLSGDGQLAELAYNYVAITAEEAAGKQQKPTQSCFYQILDSDGSVTESGYQQIQKKVAGVPFMIALPDFVDCEKQVTVQTYDELNSLWKPIGLKLTDDADEIAEICDLEECSVPEVPHGYKLWVSETMSGTAIYRFIITEIEEV
jgi:hypothetical protein